MPQRYPVVDVSTNTILGTKKRSVRLVVRRTRLSEPAQRRL
jgi:hypothetical protein